jgi:hypothetical protein
MLRNNEDCGSRGCRAYPCYEKTAHCGNEGCICSFALIIVSFTLVGYLIAFGEKYCRRFKSKGNFFEVKILTNKKLINIFFRNI